LSKLYLTLILLTLVKTYQTDVHTAVSFIVLLTYTKKEKETTVI